MKVLSSCQKEVCLCEKGACAGGARLADMERSRAQPNGRILRLDEAKWKLLNRI